MRNQAVEHQGSAALGPILTPPNWHPDRPLMTGWQSMQARAVMGELAYELGVPPKSTAVFRACKTQLAIQDLATNFDLESHSFDPELRKIYESARDRILAAKWPVPKGPNKYGRILNGPRLPNAETWTEIETISKSASNLRRDPFWKTHSEQPSHQAEYRDYCVELNTLFPGRSEYFRPGRIGPCLPPPIDLISNEFRADDLRSLNCYLLLFGAAHVVRTRGTAWPGDMTWSHHYLFAYERIVQILSKLSCIAPFRHFGEEFAVDVMKAALDEPKHVPYDWKKVLIDARHKYIGILMLAYEHGVLTKSPEYPQGNRLHEMALLRIVDARGFGNVHVAFTAHKFGNRESNLFHKIRNTLTGADRPNRI